MPLRKAWEDLTRTTVGKAPERYGVYEVGTGDGEIVEIGAGVLKDELKEALAYGAGEQVRWEATPSLERAEELADKHRDRR